MAGKANQRPSPPAAVTDALFARKKPNMERLLAFGFERRGDCLVYAANMMDNQFQLAVSVSSAGAVSTILTEAASGEEYVLHRIPGTSGAFVGKVKEEYETVVCSSHITSSSIRLILCAHKNSEVLLWNPYNRHQSQSSPTGI